MGGRGWEALAQRGVRGGCGCGLPWVARAAGRVEKALRGGLGMPLSESPHRARSGTLGMGAGSLSGEGSGGVGVGIVTRAG